MPAEKFITCLLRCLGHYALTARELDVAILIVCGWSNKEIAGLLHITEPTVKVYVQVIFNKVRIRRRSELAPLLFQNCIPNLVSQLLAEVAQHDGKHLLDTARAAKAKILKEHLLQIKPVEPSHV